MSRKSNGVTYLGITPCDELPDDSGSIFGMDDIGQRLERSANKHMHSPSEGDVRFQQGVHLCVCILWAQEAVYTIEVFCHKSMEDALSQCAFLSSVEP